MSRLASPRAAATAALVLLAADPRSALACAVCFGGKDSDWSGAFLLGTIVMLGLPPAIVISAGIAIYRGMKRQEARLRERDAQRAQQSVQQGAG
jgi:hypothetical protein